MTNRQNGTLSLGVTSNLVQRAYQHRNGVFEGFSKKYGCDRLVWFDAFDDLQEARGCELRMKKWKRAWKIELIQRTNPHWDDLFDSIAR